MVLPAWIASMITVSGDVVRARRRHLDTSIRGIAHLLFYRRVGVLGFCGRLVALAATTTASYFAGAAVATILIEAPEPVLLLAATLFLVRVFGEPDTD